MMLNNSNQINRNEVNLECSAKFEIITLSENNEI